MQVKTDTKEKFHVITVAEPSLSATMTEEIADCLLPYLQNDVKNLVLVLNQTSSWIYPPPKSWCISSRNFENNASFVICELQQPVEDFLNENELLEIMNVTPTQSEAWDIVQMEEIEREMFGEE